MGKVHSSISKKLRDFIAEQQMFFVATAPLDAQGHVNVSPKGLDSFRVLSPRQVAYLDLTGSGNETSAHLLENGRITVMFCAFNGAPMILRLYGRGRTVLPTDAEWPDLRAFFSLDGQRGERQIIVVDVDRVQTSCGYAVPLYDFVEHRDKLLRWSNRQGERRMRAYQQEKNAKSIDGMDTPIGRAVNGEATS